MDLAREAVYDNSPVFIPPPIPRTQNLSLFNSSQERTMIKVKSPISHRDDNLQFKVDHLAHFLKTQKVPPHTMYFGPPPHFRTVQDNRELNEKYWNDMVERLIETHRNTEIKRCSYTVRMYRGRPSHEPFFISKGADREYIIGATKKAVAI